MTTLNPFAWDTETASVVEASSAKRGASFLCLECDRPLFLRRGQLRVPHFAHHHYSETEANCSGGAPESWQHLQAKQLIRDHLARWQFFACCPVCSREAVKPLRFAECTVELEQSCDKYRPDATLWCEGERIAIVEVYHTHRVGEEKAAHFAARDLLMMEIVATSIIEAHHQGTYRVTFATEKCAECVALEAYKALRHCCTRCSGWELKETIIDGRCVSCRKRPCLRCRRWAPLETLLRVDAPRGQPYRDAFLCNECVTGCEQCASPIARHATQSLCDVCQTKVKQWREECRLALHSPKSWVLRKLLDTAPPGEESVYLAHLTSVMTASVESEAFERRMMWRKECVDALKRPTSATLCTLIQRRPPEEPVDALMAAFQAALDREAVQQEVGILPSPPESWCQQQAPVAPIRQNGRYLTSYYKDGSGRTDISKRFRGDFY